MHSTKRVTTYSKMAMVLNSGLIKLVMNMSMANGIISKPSDMDIPQ